MLNKSDITLVKVDWATIKRRDLILIVLPWCDQGDIAGRRLQRQAPARNGEISLCMRIKRSEQCRGKVKNIGRGEVNECRFINTHCVS